MQQSVRATLDWIASQQRAMEQLTVQWSSINSGSYHREGIRQFRQMLAQAFAPLEAKQEVIPLAPITQIDAAGQRKEIVMAEALRLRKRPEAPLQLLLVGHLDTVYGADHPFQTPVLQSPGILNGPGVADLKGGLVVMLHALLALEQFSGKSAIGWEVLLNPDEEIGSQASDPLLKQSAQGKAFGLVYEPALADGSLAGARKGSGNFTLIVNGRAAHAGRNPEEGRNAIVACAELTSQIFALNGCKPGLTVNPGHVQGGGALNTVPDLAIMRFNIRMAAAEDGPLVLEKIEQMLASFRKREGFDAALHGHFTRAPKPLAAANQQLFDLVRACAAELNQPFTIRPSGGCCDGNNLWHHGLANVDTLGVRGANIHSEKEIVYLDSLTERAQLSALLMMHLATGELRVATQ